MESRRRRAPESGTLRGRNLERLLTVAMSCPGPLTRAELIEATGFSGPTVGSLGSQLTARGLTRKVGTGPSRGGRRPSLMEFNAQHGFVAGIDLGPTRTRLAIADLRGDRLAHRIITTPTHVAPPVALSRIADAVRDLMSEAGVPPDRLLTVVRRCARHCRSRPGHRRSRAEPGRLVGGADAGLPGAGARRAHSRRERCEPRAAR